MSGDMIKNSRKEMKELRVSLERAEQVQMELDRRIFHLKTLYDVSTDIFGSVETRTILRNFLLISTGNFGVLEGFAFLRSLPSGKVNPFVSIGFQEEDAASLRRIREDALETLAPGRMAQNAALLAERFPLSSKIECAVPFTVGTDLVGLVGLGSKLTGEPYGENDRELLETLVNNLVVALKNARSFEKINQLNLDLYKKNEELENALNSLQAAMRKVEILESVKARLSKFVPATVFSMIEQFPTGEMPESREQDLSVLFIDIEGYTKICEKLGSAEVNEVIEKSFSVFMNAIYSNSGDVNETAGDGLMVIFLDGDKTANALQAVKTALSIRAESDRIEEMCSGLPQPLVINMGINSGPALVGAAKFESYTGSRWTYTARGTTTNIAARIGALADNGKILLSRETAERVKDRFMLHPYGTFRLKNVSSPMEIFQV